MNMIYDSVDYLLKNWMTGWMGLLLYWLPLFVCVVGYSLRTAENFQKDVNEREKVRNLKKKQLELADNPEALDEFNNKFLRTSHFSDKYKSFYSHTDKIGTLIGRVLVSIVPFVNLWASVFNISPKLFGRFFEQIEKIFNTPLVPEDKD